ncbi:S9 family peptidase, partial [Phenylobacterium sp.]|uniref:alpha/beta hydrolase family protein n=1 Tax=Phenylobacterium sp. TaxID=1871053 RepID=UPI00121D967E
MKICLAALAAAAVTATPALAEPPPASAFGRIPAIVTAKLSPDGKRVAILGGASDQRFVSIGAIDQTDVPTVPLGNVEGVGLTWAGNDYVLARIAVLDKQGPRTEYRLERNIAISAKGELLNVLLGKDSISRFIIHQAVLGTPAATPTRAFVEGLVLSEGPSSDMNTHIARKGVENPFVAALWSVDPQTGTGNLTERGDYDTVTWEVDSTGQARVRLEIDQLSHDFSVWGRPKGARQWSRVWAGGDYDSRRQFYGYSEPDDAIYLGLDGQLVLKSLTDGTTKPLGPAQPMTNPILVWDPYRITAVGIRTGGEKPEFDWLDPEIGAVHTALSKVFKDKAVELTGWSTDRTRFVAKVDAPGAPSVWYLFDKTRKELSPIGEEYPELKGAVFGTTRWITYKARDGQEIPAYLTLPPGAQAQGAKAPLIVLPHGGPGARDTYEFDFLAQFLATRGYAVLQPQFRGSWGFGKAFEDAGQGEWGGKMQTDLLDGIAAAAASGDIDPTRVCIVGASYGGYAALAGVTLHPDAYRCAASIAGVSDLGLFVVEQVRLFGTDTGGFQELRKMLAGSSTAKLVATSPAHQAAAIRAPVLLIHGDKDTVVPFEQTQHMADAMKAAGKPVEMVTLVD